jgi:hypothetical protein
MVSNLRKQDGQNSGDNVFQGILVGSDEADLFLGFLDAHDFSPNTRRAFRQDVRKSARWFNEANRESFVVDRVASDFYAPDVRVMKNSFVVFAYANRVEIKVKIEEMVFIDGKCYVMEID